MEKLNGTEIPEHVTPAAERVLRDLTFHRVAGRNPPEHWFTTLRDAPRRGVVRAAVQRLAGAALRDLPAPAAWTPRRTTVRSPA